MRRRPALRESRLIHAAVGASMLAVPASAAAGGDSNASPKGLRVAKRHLDVAGARTIRVWGKLLPVLPGHRVRLEALIGRRWETLSMTRTGKLGRFELRFQPHGPGRERLRVQTAGGPSGVLRSPAGSVTVYRQGVASWYYDGGQTACGFHAQYGVANVSLPCGTKVRFMKGGHRVTAVVDDRGPYVGGREWDLNQSTAAALGFSGVGSVWSTR
jgi:rare lipoprotein A